MTATLLQNFPTYTNFNPSVPVWCVTPNLKGVIHRFFDSSPFSPSGRYIALTGLPFEDRLPQPGDLAEVILVDLHAGTSHVVARTRGWDTQLGAQVQWGTHDTELYFNDVDPQTWQAFGVKLNPFSGKRQLLEGCIYAISPDGQWSASACLLRIGKTQAGYGVIVPPQLIPPNRGASVDDGIYLTHLPTGKRKLLVSLDEIVRAIQLPLKEYKAGDFYGFHVKWNPQGDRLMFVLRWLPRDRRFPLLKRFQKKPKLKLNLVTLKPDGSDIHLAIPDAEWSKGGHHPNWCPDGETILMNLNLHGDGLRFVRVKYDGTECEAMTQKLMGSGHPTLHPDEKHILTDAYPHEPVAFGDGTTPLRWVDFDRGEEQTLIRIQTAPSFRGPKGQLRVDPHPAWDRQSRRIAFNACPDGTRRVYVADLSQLL
jgi:hypothetical protein